MNAGVNDLRKQRENACGGVGVGGVTSYGMYQYHHLGLVFAKGGGRLEGSSILQLLEHLVIRKSGGRGCVVLPSEGWRRRI